MKWIYRFFVVLGVIFFLLLIGLGYFVIADPLHLRPIIMNMYNTDTRSTVLDSSNDQVPVESNTEVIENTEVIKNPGVMTTQQEAALESVGINPDAVPAQFTPEQIACFTRILGEDRVNEIKAGDTPSPVEFYQAKECMNV